MSAYRSSLFWSLKKEVSEKLPQGSLAVYVSLQAAPVGYWGSLSDCSCESARTAVDLLR